MINKGVSENRLRRIELDSHVTSMVDESAPASVLFLLKMGAGLQCRLC